MSGNKFLIVMAAGSGVRMGGGVPKQFLDLGGVPILRRTIETFVKAVPDIKVIIVLPKDHISFWKEYCVSSDFTCPQTLVMGGFTRFHSVRNALEKHRGNRIRLWDFKKELEKHGVALVEATISSVNDIQQAAQSLIGKADVFYVPTDNVVASAMPTLYSVTKPAKLAVVAGEAGMVKSGATATVAVDYYNLGKIAGNMGADILEGKAKPQDMPIRYQTEFNVVMNETVAKELGLVVPEDIAKTVTWVK